MPVRGALDSLRANRAISSPLRPKKIRDLISDLERAGFANRGGKGSHRNFVHPRLAKPLTLAGKLGDDAKRYQVRAVELALEDLKK